MRELQEAKQIIQEQDAVLKRIASQALLKAHVESVEGAFVYIKNGDKPYRIQALENTSLQTGDCILLHPETLQIVEKLPKPPLQASPFAPASPPSITWDDIGGLEDAKAEMREAVEMPHLNKELFKFYNKRPARGILLYGPPGCGKTLLGKGAANALARIYDKKNAPSAFLYVKGPELLSPYVGAAEQTIREIFADARRHREEHGFPAVIFIDEADAILSKRGSRSTNGMEKTIVPMFLTEMDGLEETAALVILATNRAGDLDPAIVRDGRIDRKVKVTRPTPESALDIVLLNLKTVPIANDLTRDELAAVFVAELFSRTVNGGKLSDILSGAMIARCVDYSVSLAMRRDIKAGVKQGLSMADVVPAVDGIVAQNADVSHDTMRMAA